MLRRPWRMVTLARLTPFLVALIVLSQSDAVPTQTPALPQHGILDFGTLGGAAASFEDISDFAQQLAGQSQTASGATHATVVSEEGELRDLGTLGGASSVAYGASYGVVVGQSQTASGQTHAFRISVSGPNRGTMIDLGTLGGTWSAAYSIHQGTIVGASTVAGSNRLQAFTIGAGGMTPLPVSAAGDSVARDAFYDDQVVGYACTAGNASCRAFWFKEGAVTTLPSLGGNSAANAINGSPTAYIVGGSVTAGGATHAFLYTNGAITDLGTLGGQNSEALEVNQHGDVVGVSDVAGGGTRAFLWRNGTMHDLNTVLPSGSGWVLQKATGISDAGQIVGVGTFNGATRGFLLTPPADLQVRPGGVRSQHDSNLPRGAEVGRNITIVNSVVGMPEGLTIYGARYTATLTGPAEYVGPVRSYDTDGSECTVAPKMVTCDVPAIDTIGLGREYWLTVRTTGPGTITHQGSVSSNIPDTNPVNNTLTENNYAVALAALDLRPSTVAGGKVSSARVTLTGIPPAGDAVVRLSSSRQDIAPVPATLIVPAHNASPSRELNIIPAVVSQPTTVDITATYGLVTITKTLTVVPPALTQLYLTPTTVVGGCGSSAGKVVLTGAAPASGAVVSLTNTNSAATAPSTVTVPAGASSQTFTVTTRRVTTNVSGTVTASYGGVSKALALTVRPLRVKTLTVTPNPATGGSTATASLTLECAAPAGGLVVSLFSSNAAVAAPTVSSITIPAGGTTASFSVRTSSVAASTSVNIYATVYGVRKSAALTVRP